MNIAGLITEYNPFHNGHLYHIEKTKELTGADALIVVMSGNYVQRGTPAFLPKHLRAEMALRAGASVIVELPVCYATGSAEYFAMGAVSLLDKLGCVNSICFGSESGELADLNKTAEILVEEPPEFQEMLLHNLKKGMTFPAARSKAFEHYITAKEIVIKNVLETPNNILGIEYLKALQRLHSKMTPYTIKREESHYHDEDLQPNYSSASAIRRLLTEDHFPLAPVLEALETQVPADCLELIRKCHRTRYPIYFDDYSLLLKFKLLSETKESLTQFADVSEELANKMVNNCNNYIRAEQFCELLHSKDMTYTRVQRALLHILLNIKKRDLEIYQRDGYHFYAHMLGFRRDSKDLLTQIKAHSLVPLLAKLTNPGTLSPTGMFMLKQDIDSANLYESVITNKFKTSFIHEYEQSVIRI